MNHLTISHESQNGWTVLTVSGELDVYTAYALRTAVADQIFAGKTDIILNVGRVAFMDSSGLGVLISSHRNVQALGGQLVVVTERKSTLKLLRISGLFSVLDVLGSVADAIAARSPRPPTAATRPSTSQQPKP